MAVIDRLKSYGAGQKLMPGPKPCLQPARLKKAAPFILAAFIYSGKGGFPTDTNYVAWPGFTFTFFSAAMADDGRHGGGWGNGGGGWGSHGGDGGSGGGGWSNGGGGWASHGGDGRSSAGGGSSNGGGDGGWGNGGGGGLINGGAGSGSQGGGGGSGGSGSDSGRASYARSCGGGSGSNPSSVSYDASRNVMKLDFKIGWGKHHDLLESAPYRSKPEPHRLERESHRRHEHEHAAPGIRERYFHDHDRRRFDGYLRNVLDGWKERDSVEALNQSVNSIAASKALAQPSDTPATSAAASYESPASAQQNDTPVDSTAKSYGRSASAQQRDRTVAGNTSLAIGNLAFMPNEVLAVGLDPASIERAKALGFKADPQAIALKASDHIVTRLTVPPGLDAARGRELLSRELPGRRFELNKVYRLYRAAVREEETAKPDKDKPTPAIVCDARRTVVLHGG